VVRAVSRHVRSYVPLVSRRARWEIAAIVGWSAWWFAFDPRRFGFLLSWHFFVAGAHRMMGLKYSGYPLPGGVHLFASYPKLQIGPLSFLVAAPIAFLPHLLGQVIAVAFMTAAGPVTIGLVADAGRRVRGWPLETAIRSGAAAWFFIVPLWSQLAVCFGHLDDVLALLFVAAAVNALSRANPTMAAICIGASAASKPWAAAFIPLALAAADGRRLRHLAESVAVVVVVWAPFVLGDMHTLRAASFKIPIAKTSVLALFHVTGGTPNWVRPCQILGGALLAVVCVRSGRWAAVVVVVVALRLGVDPNIYSYYTAGILVGASVWDLLGSRYHAPLLTAAGFLSLYWATYWPLAAPTQARIRLGYVLVVPLVVIMTATRQRVVPPAVTIAATLQDGCV
jgi:hypothetical protein